MLVINIGFWYDMLIGPIIAIIFFIYIANQLVNWRKIRKEKESLKEEKER